MPELPGVEAIARTMRPLVLGQTIRCVRVFHPVLIRPQTVAHLNELARGRRIENVSRVGRYLFLNLDRGRLLLNHINRGEDGTHTDIAFELSSGALGIVDPRHLAQIHAGRTERIAAH